MNKFPASTVKGAGFSLIREEGRHYYNIVRDNVQRPLSANLGHTYKDASTGQYKVVIGQATTVHADFNAVKRFVKEVVQG